MLSKRERHLLELIEADLAAGDKRLAAAMRDGRPEPPREYRRTWTIVLAVLSVVGMVAVVVTEHWGAALALLAVAVVALVRYVRRRLD